MTYNIKFTYCGLWLGYSNIKLSWRYILTFQQFTCFHFFLLYTELSAMNTVLTLNTKTFHALFHRESSIRHVGIHLLYWPQNANPLILIRISCHWEISFLKYGDGELMLNWSRFELMFTELDLSWCWTELVVSWCWTELVVSWCWIDLVVSCC